MTQIQEYLPKKPYCTDDPRTGLLIRPRETALKHNYLQLNPPCTQWAMVFDLDYLTTPYIAQEANLPEPTFLVLNKKNLHSHMIYHLSNPICTTDAARMAPLRYAAAIETAYQTRLRSDPHYVGLISKNPWKDDYWTVVDNSNLAYDLNYMADFVTLPKRPKKQPQREISGLGRNCALFDTVRHWAYSAIRESWRPEGAELWAQAVHEYCLEANIFPNPLGERELRCISRSIAKWTWRRFRPGEFAAWQKRRIEKRWGVRKPQGVEMLVEGCSTEEVATALEVSTRTARRWRRSALQEIPLSEQKPWEDEGISRATWYRRQGMRQNLAQNGHTISDNSRQAVHNRGVLEGAKGTLKPWEALEISKGWYYKQKKASALQETKASSPKAASWLSLSALGD